MQIKVFLFPLLVIIIILLYVAKGQIKPKADWCAVDSPKKEQTSFFAVKSKKAKKQIGSFVFWENLRRANLLMVLSDLYATYW